MHTANIVSKVPGNRNFDKVVEFSDPFRLFWSKKAYFGTQIIFYLCTLCVNIAAIIDTAQVVDSFVGHSFGTWGYGFDNDAPGVQEWKHLNPCSRKHVKLGKCIPFDPEKYGYIIITLGYLITAAVFLPICLMDLKVSDFNWIELGASNLCRRRSPLNVRRCPSTFFRKIPHGRSLDSWSF